MAQRPVVHIENPLPDDAAHIDTQFIALVNVVVNSGGQQIVSRRNGMHVPRKMNVDIFHRQDLGMPAAGGAALDPEDGAERRFAHGRNRLLAEKVKRLRQTDRCHGLPFSGRSRVDSRHQDEFTVFMPLQPFNGGKRNFCFVLAVKLQIVFRQTHLRGNLRNRL